MYSKSEIRNSSANPAPNLQSVNLKTSGRTAQLWKGPATVYPFLSVENKEALELCYAGKNGIQRAKVRSHPWQGECAWRARSACCGHSPPTPKSDSDGLFPSTLEDFKVYPGLTVLRFTSLWFSTSCQTTRAENFRESHLRSHNCVWLWWRRLPLANVWDLLIPFLSSLAGHLNLETEWAAGKMGLFGVGSMLWELEPWLGVTFVER